jgi:hypothetical protein
VSEGPRSSSSQAGQRPVAGISPSLGTRASYAGPAHVRADSDLPGMCEKGRRPVSASVLPTAPR